MEHWHRSPKALFHEALTWLRPGGLLVIGVPNCVNLRKRLTVPLGRSPKTLQVSGGRPETEIAVRPALEFQLERA
jgi:SAM-dependent methyltransferase